MPEASFRPSRAVMALAAVCLAVMAAVMVGVGLNPHPLTAAVKMLAIAAASGWMFALLLRFTWGRSHHVCPGGLVRRAGRTVDVLRWAEVREVWKETGRNHYAVVPRAGEPWVLDVIRVSDLDGLSALLKRYAARHRIPWVIVDRIQSDLIE